MEEEPVGMRIALVCPTPPPYGGITNWSKMLIAYLEGLGEDELTVINTSPKTRSADGRTLFDRVFGGIGIAVRASRELKRLLNTKNIDVVHVTTSGGLGLFRDLVVMGVAQRAGVPVAYHIHYGRVPSTLASGNIEAALLKAALKRCAVAIAIDHATENAIRETRRCDVVCIGNPVNIAELDGFCDHEAFEDSKTVVYLGWLIETKGIRELVEGWSSVVRRMPEWRLRLIGPYDTGTISSLVGDHPDDSITLLGELPHSEAMTELQRASVLVLPSYSEGFPNVVLEAMAYGKPVLATNVGALPDILSDGRGILIEPKSSKQVAQGLEKLMANADLRVSMGTRCAVYAKDNFAIEAVAEQYRELWISLASKRHRFTSGENGSAS